MQIKAGVMLSIICLIFHQARYKRFAYRIKDKIKYKKQVFHRSDKTFDS